MNLGCPVNTIYAVQHMYLILYPCLSHTHKHTSLPDIGELVVHIPHVIFDVNGDAGRLQHLHGELLREGTNKQSSDSVDAGDLVRHADLFGLVPVLQVQYTYRQKAGEQGEEPEVKTKDRHVISAAWMSSDTLFCFFCRIFLAVFQVQTVLFQL